MRKGISSNVEMYKQVLMWTRTKVNSHRVPTRRVEQRRQAASIVVASIVVARCYRRLVLCNLSIKAGANNQYIYVT